MAYRYELINIWRKDGFVLKVWDTNTRDHPHGRHILAYKLYDGDELIFKGTDFCCSLCKAVDSVETIEGILAFLSLRPGDTDREYFDDYTPRQMEWCQSARCEELACIRCEIEERLSAKRERNR